MTEQPTPWCCRGWAQGCPLCPDYGTRKTDPCPGHDDTPAHQQTIATAALHARQAHPGWEYAVTEGPRKQWDYSDEPPGDDNGVPDPTWQRNIDAGYPGEGWERFDYTEESYWRRPLAEDAEPVANDEHPAAGYCPHCGSGDAGPTPEAYETARQRAVLLQTRIDNARDWARHNLDGEQQAGLLGVLRGDGDASSPLNDALRLILADTNRHELTGHHERAAGLRIAARHLLAAQKEPRP